MAKNTIKIDLDDKQVQAKLQDIKDKAEGTAPMMRAIGTAIKSRVRLGFRKGVDPYGLKWLPIKGRDGQPLRDTGRLQASIEAQTSKDYADIGTNVIYGPIHQFGGTIKAKNVPWLIFKMHGKTVRAKSVDIPARKFLPILGGQVQLPDPWKNSALNAIKNHLGLA